MQPNDDEGIEQIEANGRNNEPVHGGNIRRVVTQKGAPSLTGRPGSLDHVFGDARLRHFKPKLEQFAMNTWRSPKWVFDAHPPDQRTQVRIDLRSPSPLARFPSPVAAKAGPVPTLNSGDAANLGQSAQVDQS